MNELATLSLFLVAIAALIASFTAVERRLISAIDAGKVLFSALILKKSQMRVRPFKFSVLFLRKRALHD
jgi:hypothetical protein